MKIIICGGRHFNDYRALELIMDNILDSYNIDYADVEIVSGNCEGADMLGEYYAKDYGCGLSIFKADWKKYGKAAGPIRNKQMIDYIKSNKNNIVIAFISPNSKGTKNTVDLAKKAGITVYEIPYTINESDYELFEGISRNDDGEFVIDWSSNTSSDIVKLSSSCAHFTKFNKMLRCYGYKINPKADKDDRMDFIKYIKINGVDSLEFSEMLDKMIEDFYENSPIKHFDYILRLPSRSPINKAICDRILDAYDNGKEIELVKKPTSDIEFDWEKFKKTFKGNYLDKMISFINKYIDRLKEDENFSISKISPRYRRYFNPMIDLGKDSIESDANTNLLIIDDTFTTGSSINMVFDALANAGFKGNIVTLTLLNNR